MSSESLAYLWLLRVIHVNTNKRKYVHELVLWRDEESKKKCLLFLLKCNFNVRMLLIQQSRIKKILSQL